MRVFHYFEKQIHMTFLQKKEEEHAYSLGEIRKLSIDMPANNAVIVRNSSTRRLAA